MNNYCPDLFNTIFVQKVNETDLQVGHCCVSKLSTPANNIDFNNQFLTDNRQHFLDNNTLPDACAYCVNSESKGAGSRRINRLKPNREQNLYPLTAKLEHLDYNCDNICNLKCIICSGYYSSAWREDEVLLGLRTNQKTKPTKHNDAIYSVDVTNLKSIYFNGGEPLMTRDHLNVLNHVINNSNPANITLHYSSNGTFPLTEEISAVWRQFKSVYVNFSIDAVGSTFEYIRFPAVWTDVDANIKTFNLPNIIIKITATIGVHNILYFDELYTWANGTEIYIQDTNGRSGLAVQNFPLLGKDYLLDYINNLPNSNNKQILLNLANNILGNNTPWKAYLDRLDQIRGNNWHESLSRLYNVSIGIN
jgi:hypothetical protein